MFSHLCSEHHIDCVQTICECEGHIVRDPKETDEHPDELLPYRIVCGDSYYSVRQAFGREHAIERFREDHPDRVITRVTVVR